MATIRRRGNAWQLNYTDPASGRRVQKSLGPVTQAEAEAQRLAIEKRLGGGAPAAGPAFAQWAITYATWRSQEYPDSYYRVEQILRTHLIPAFGPLPIASIGPQEAEQYKHRRLQTAKANTVRQEIQVLKACLNLAVKWEIISRSRIAYVSPPRDLNSKPPRWFSTEELAQIYAVELNPIKCQQKDDRERHRRYRWTWQLLANTGLRRAEARALTWQDIGKEEIRVISRENARTKSGKWRAVPISEGAGEALEALRGDTHVLPSVGPTSISRAFDRTLARANLSGSLHCLRHTYCSHLVMAGVPLRTVQILAGHSSYKTTERYAHLAPGHLRDAVRDMAL